jgi:hypothetical protein
MRSPIAVPPGSRVSSTSIPRERRASANSRAWVLLPAPSGPSSVMKTPGPVAMLATTRAV